MLDESIGISTIVGLDLILGGVSLASGKVRLTRRSVAPARP